MKRFSAPARVSEVPGCASEVERRRTHALAAFAPSEAALAEHVRHCLACRLERRNFELALGQVKLPSPGFYARLSWAIAACAGREKG